MQKKLLFFACLLLGFLIVDSQLSMVHAPYLGGNCVLDLPMDEGVGTTTYDQSGYGNNGSLLPLLLGPTWVNGKYGKAISFDGSNDYVLLSASSSLNIFSALTISAWVWITASPTGQEEILDCHVNTHYRLGLINGGKARAYAHGHSLDSVNAIPIQQWEHLALTWDSTTANYTLYVNGQLITNSIFGSGTISGSYQVTVGCYSEILNLGIEMFNGIIDDVRIYNLALTQAEITVLYNAGFTSHQPETFSFSSSQTQKQEQKHVYTSVYSYSDGTRIMQEQKWVYSETVNYSSVSSSTTTLPVYATIGFVTGQMLGAIIIMAIILVPMLLIIARKRR